jgi:hypothetical protein
MGKLKVFMSRVPAKSILQGADAQKVFFSSISSKFIMAF